MARINTKQLLVDYIKGQLGHPVIRIEVTDPQIEQIIDDTVHKFTSYAFHELEDAIILQINGPGVYALPDQITNIIACSKGGMVGSSMNFGQMFGENLTPNIWSDMMSSSDLDGVLLAVIKISAVQSIIQKYFGNEIYYNFNANKKILQVFEDYTGPVLLHYHYEYLADAVDYIYDKSWVKEWALAKTKFLWGTITGKYDQSLIGAGRINYGDMKSEAMQELDRLNEELLTRWTDPAPIDIG